MNFLNLFAACQKELSLDWRQYLALKCAWNTGGRKVTLLEGVRRKQGRKNQTHCRKGKPNSRSEGLLPTLERRKQPCFMTCAVLWYMNADEILNQRKDDCILKPPV